MQQIVDVAISAARAGSEVLLRYYGKAEVEQKAGRSQDLVTQADIEAEQAIVSLIQAAFPDHGVLGEEGSNVPGSQHLWVIDPLDGTTNYAHQIPQFSTSVAYTQEAVSMVGVVIDPIRNEVFHAARGRGAYLNGSQIQTSERASLAEAVIATGFYYDRGQLMRKTLSAIEALFENNIRGIRRFGGAALDQCWVANGRLDAFFEYQLAPWDYAAGALIVEEAGGRTACRDGGTLRLDSGSVIATNSMLFEHVLASTRWGE